MSVLDLVYKRLKNEEGVKFEVYLDHLGYPTAGIGHLLPDEYKSRVGEPVSEEQVYNWFSEDVKTAVHDAEIFAGSVWDLLSDNRKAVLIEMAFQLGGVRLSGFRNFKKNLERVATEGSTQEVFEACAKEMRDSAWYKQTPTRAEECCTIFVTDQYIIN